MMAWISKVTAILVLAAITISLGRLTDDDFRIVNRQDLLSDSDTFEDRRSKSFSQLLFDVGREQVVVGARDALYRLSLRGLRQLERAEWPAPADKAKFCQDKGQSEDDCHNYIKVLLMYKDKLFACGTNAFSPMCTWRELESINTITEWVTGVANCPCNPHSNVTSLLAGGGEYYAGTPTDFSSSDITVCRSRGAAPTDRGTLRATQYDLNWLNEPQFVGSFEDDTFVYFVFREVAVEFMDCGKIVYSRIARVCKNESGGRPRSANAVGEWSTFLKARLKCPVPGDVPFYYDEVQSVEYLPDQKILVATFTTPSNSIIGSAVCVYNMSDIHAAFEGPYRVRDKWDTNDKWEPRAPSQQARDHFKCINNQITEYHRYHLMYESVQPISGEPIYKATLERFTHVTVDVIPTRSGSQLIVYVATERSDILKMVVLPRLDGACLVEVLKLKDEKGGYDVRSMQFVKDTMSLYIGSDTGVLRIAGQRCSRYKSQSSCVGASDPYCGWDDERELCALRTVGEEVISCPSDDSPVAGGWSSWSTWEPCMQHGTASAYNERGDMCACRHRRCDNPPPKRGGATCEGPSIAVTNCTVHGGWSAWSGWSACSASCGIGVKSRRRACGAPEPRFGGRVCVGLDVQDMICTDLPPCPDPALAPVDGGWSAWGAWSPCAGAGAGSPGCGPAGGWRERRRSCTDPKPRNGGSDCEGPKMEQQICDLRPCELRKATAWTPWVQIPGNTSDGSYTEKRFKFLCKAPSPEQLKLSIAREEERYCSSRGSCTSSPPDEGGWEAWGPWGPCSAPCGGGQQARTRRCRRPPCVGAREMLRACNVHACSGEWSCWSDWGECSGNCGTIGHRTRTRACLSPAGCPDAAAALETKACYNACPESGEGWGEWGEWSSCDNGERVRRRNCAGNCAGGGGAQIQLAKEHTDDSDNELYAMPAYSPNVEMASFVTMDGNQKLSVGGIVGCVLAAFVSGCLLCLAGVIYTQRRGSRLPWSRNTRVPSSPHYITKQNSYVTVPLKEVPRKAKRQPSFTGIGGSAGILLAKSNNLANANNHNTAVTPKLYPKAIANEYDSMGTLRRHSNQPNNRSNLDAEEDKFY